MGSRLLQASAPTLGSIPRESRLAKGVQKTRPSGSPSLGTCISVRGGGQEETLRIWQQLPASFAGWY